MSKLPVYNPAKDGNKFQWIIDQAANIRARKIIENAQSKPRLDYLTGKLKNNGK